MRRLAEFLRIRTSEKLLLIKCAALLAGVQAGLAAIGYRRLEAILAAHVKPRAGASPAGRLIWGVRTAGRALPGVTCLGRAVALHFLLCRAGHDSVIRVGVAADGRLQFDAHAWVVCEGRVVIGDAGEDLARYAILTDLRLKAP
jgi:hypothetical protein